jgi:hypothetical protein
MTSDVFGFRITEARLRAIAAWRETILPQVQAYQRQKYADQPWVVEIMDAAVWMTDGGAHLVVIRPDGDSDWRIAVGLLPDIYPTLTLELAGGVEVITAPGAPGLLQGGPDNARQVWNVMREIMISGGLYTSLLDLGWSPETARQYEYRFNPSGVGIGAHVRRVGAAAWIRLEDPHLNAPDYEP